MEHLVLTEIFYQTVPCGLGISVADEAQDCQLQRWQMFPGTHHFPDTA